MNYYVTATVVVYSEMALMFENDLIGVTASGLQLRQLKALLSYDGSSDWPHFRILLKPNFQSALDTQTVPDSADRGDRKGKKNWRVGRAACTDADGGIGGRFFRNIFTNYNWNCSITRVSNFHSY
ncbi:hypothetical protein D917_02994 [Trichinella nativa]|uniref:Uncharacterized protein n=1 Tax=Trichinella nativa TaxID=6335 RepID=A0A1Y3EEZ0_9BILA|nr:hypothetical protein D917_02994 [Trichinella nativa]